MLTSIANWIELTSVGTVIVLGSDKLLASLGSLPWINSTTLEWPSWSRSPSASLGSIGLKPWESSQPSGMPSVSLSVFLGLVPIEYSSMFVKPSPSESASASLSSRGSSPLLYSQPSGIPSPSVSELLGLRPLSSSQPSQRPSSSVSLSFGSSPMWYSWRFVRLSVSGSSFASLESIEGQYNSSHVSGRLSSSLSALAKAASGVLP